MPSPTRRRPGRPRKVPLAEQRVAVLRAARRVFARSGLRGATIEEIARCAGMNRHAVYELFVDKGALFDAVLAEVTDELAPVIVRPAREEPAELADEPDHRPWVWHHLTPPFAYCAEHPDVLTLLKEARRANNRVFLEFRARVARHYADALGERLARRGHRPGRLPAIVVGMFITMTDAVLTENWADGEQPRTDTLLELTEHFTAGGLERLLRAPVGRALDA